MMKNKVLNKSTNIHVALIATYPEMTKILLQLSEEEGVTIDNYYASFGEAVEIANRIKNDVDAIMTRGGTGQAIKDNVNLPIVSIPITPFDLFRSVERLPGTVKEIAFVNFDRKIYGVRDIEKYFNVKIHELTFRNKNDIERGIRSVKELGVKTIIGGNIAAEYARLEGLTGIEISSGEEAVHRALQETIALVEARRIEQKKTQRLSVAFNSISEGIIISDEKMKVYFHNTASKNLFGLSDEDVMSKSVDTIIKDNQVAAVFDTKIAKNNHIFNINDVIVNISHIPIHLDEKFIGVVSRIEDVTKIQNLEGQIRNKLSEKGFYAKHTFDDIVTCNKNMINLKEIAMLYAPTKSTVLIEGESGTGKELFAQSIHNSSNCANGPFVAVNCAAIPEQLLESELFGYEGGAFTGAKKDGKPGLFEMANNGTIFLDEIGEVPRALQARLLRVLQEKEVMRIGGNKMLPINVRVIGATNKNLKEKVLQGEFRDDLYYRLNVFNIKIPALRERREDIPMLFSNFIEQWNTEIEEEGYEILNKEIMPALCAYDWPGNIRELNNITERLGFFLNGKTHLKQWHDMIKEIEVSSDKDKKGCISTIVTLEDELKVSIAKVEKTIIENMLDKYDGNQDEVAEKLGIGKTTLWRKLNGIT